jgi:hypothetical protein
MVIERNAYRLLVAKQEGKKTLGGPRHRWMDNIKIDLAEVGLSDLDCRAVVNAVMSLEVPYNSGKQSSGFTTCDLSSSAQPRIFS